MNLAQPATGAFEMLRKYVEHINARFRSFTFVSGHPFKSEVSEIVLRNIEFRL